jgi:hypothetical protein
LIFGLISLQKKIDGQSLANMEDVPWYGVGPSDPVPVPILGPDIIDPRQMEIIRQQAERAAKGEPYGVRELPAAAIDVVAKKVTAGAKAAPAVAAPTAAEVAATDPEKAERLRKREEALARKRAREGSTE